MSEAMIYMVLLVAGVTALAWWVVRGLLKVKSSGDPEIMEARAVFLKYLGIAPLGVKDPLLDRVKYVLRDLSDMEKEIEDLNAKIAGPDSPMKGPWKIERNAIFKRIRSIRGECQQVLDQMQNP